MAKQLYNPRKAKIHRSYTLDEVAKLYDVHKNTVRNWIKQGLPILDNRKPFMVLGSALNSFHAERRKKLKQPCNTNQIYCMRCRIPQIPKSKQVSCKSVGHNTANLVGICPACSSLMYRRVSLRKFEQFKAVWDIKVPQGNQHIVNTGHPPVNCELKIQENM